eukprot:3363270-Rhodomonas_salina.1
MSGTDVAYGAASGAQPVRAESTSLRYSFFHYLKRCSSSEINPNSDTRPFGTTTYHSPSTQP